MADMTTVFNETAGAGFSTAFSILMKGAGTAIVLAWFAWTIMGFYEAFSKGTRSGDLLMPSLRALVMVSFLLFIFS
ncbi:hypothetical protein [Motilimonas cestriensis]|uniref:hypothetical protein n=1 Tax=Motilimonas cestriensis TaxID=2742685 RepID=UPI003DA3C868